MAKQKKTSQAQPPLKFDQKLVLNQWILNLFEAKDFEQLAKGLKAPEYEGLDEDNISRFHYVLSARLFQRKELTSDILLAYDQNIVRHWKAITERRNMGGQILNMKYFQYLSLLFTEIYLDRYFRDEDKLLADLNNYLDQFNDDKADRDKLDHFKPNDLNKLAFWSATGSGKTLLMHVNILQYKQYLKAHNKERSMNRIILLTPNEGLSNQHLEEFGLSGMDAELFSKEGRGLYTGRPVVTSCVRAASPLNTPQHSARLCGPRAVKRQKSLNRNMPSAFSWIIRINTFTATAMVKSIEYLI